MDKELLNQEKSFIAMCKFLLWLFTSLIITFIGISNVMAITYTDIGYVQHLSGVNGSVTIDVSYETSSGAPLPVNRNQTVYTQIKVLNVFIDNYNFLANTQYQIEMEMLNETLQYANTFEVYGNNNELCLVSYTNSDFVGHHYPKFNFQCETATSSIYLKVYNSSNTSITDKSNWSWSYMFLRTTTEKIDNNSDSDNIINNQNQNTQNIIANQNQNTQDIINNQNENTEKEIESQKVCELINIDKNNIIDNNKFLGTDGNLNNGYNVGVTDYINIENVTNIYVNSLYNNQYVASCFYTSNKTLISCISSSNMTLNSSIAVPDNSYYFRASIYFPTNSPSFTFNQCRNGNQALNDSITGLNDSLNDDDSSGATSEASDFFSSFTTNTFGLTSIITAPLNLIQSLTSSTCSELHLPLPYLNNKYLDLPCMTSIYQSHFGSFFTMYQTITYGIIAYWVIVRIFNQVKDFKNPEHDEIEVVDL